jgi:hypothetical protein
MELRGSRPPGIVRADALKPLLDLRGPVLSLYLNTDPAVENAAHRDEQRWRSTRRRLSDEGVPEAMLADIDPLVEAAHLEGSCLAVIANGEGIAWVEHDDAEMTTEVHQWRALPHLVPLIEWRQRRIPYVLVTADRTGADLDVVVPGERDEHLEAGGATFPIRKVQPGGWSQHRFQQRAENTWEHNAHDAAEQLIALVREAKARAVFAGGDVRALQLLRDALPREVGELVVEVTATRAQDGSEQRTPADVRRAVETVVRHDTTEVLRKYAEELGQNDRAVEGLDETVGALERAQVDVLLLMESALPDRTAWFGAQPTTISTKPNVLEAFGTDQPTEAPLVDVMVRAAIGTDPGFTIVSSDELLTEGVGALLRWT